jgi:hypothetical protein
MPAVPVRSGRGLPQALVTTWSPPQRGAAATPSFPQPNNRSAEDPEETIVRSRPLTIALSGMTIALIAGCTGGAGTSTSSSSGGGKEAFAADSAGRAPAAAGAPSFAAGADQPAATPTTPVQHREFVRTASLSVRVADVDRTAATVLAKGAAVSAELDGDTRTGEGAQRQATLVLRVPPARLTGLIAVVVGLGHELDRKDNGTDVTAVHADINARVQALQTSIGRLTDFLSHSGSITDLVALESDLTQRESQLESMQAQQRSLADQIALSTLTVQLVRNPDPVVVARSRAHGPAGFGTALGRGTHAVVVSFRWLSAGLGYALPFGGLLALVGIVAVAVLRRRTGASIIAPEPDPAATP